MVRAKRQLFRLDHRAITYREGVARCCCHPVRRLSEREELIFVTGVTAARRKLRYDGEPIFRARLLPAP
ncbi:MAG: hypothetical protein R3C31_15675 [Hyphomonadaceae bacterium]